MKRDRYCTQIMSGKRCFFYGLTRHLRHFFIFFLSMILLVWQGTVSATTTLRVDPQQIQVSDTFHLILSSDNAQSGGLPNLAPLQNDFTILGTERSLSYSMVNGQSSSQSQWIILLRPKRSGKLTIPPIKVGQEQTKPSFIDVSSDGTINASSENKSNTQDESNDLMLKASISEQRPYVNQQVLLTVKLYSNKQLINAEYHPPSVENALLIPLGDGRHYQTQVKGMPYEVEEQQYAIFPQKSGVLTFRPPSFHATIYDQFPKPVTIEAKTKPISVLPAPTDYQGKNWLPAKKITLAETYDPPKEMLKEGDTVTRTVILKAVAMPAQLLPILSFDASGGFNIYPESPEVKNTVSQNELVGTSTTKITYLLNQGGRTTIPALEVPWFNTVTGKTEIATLPARTFIVEANENASVKKTDTLTSHQTVSHTGKTDEPRSVLSSFFSKPIAWAFIAGFGAAGGLFALMWWFKHSRRFNRNYANHTAVKRLREACQKNRPAQARDALLDWAHSQWPGANILNLQDIGKLTRDSAMKKQLLALNQALYNPNPAASWQGTGLWQSFNTYRQQKPGKNYKRSDLPPIHPI